MTNTTTSQAASEGLPKLERSIEQWRACEPKAMATQSTAAIQFALADAKHDILALYSALSNLPVVPAGQAVGEAISLAGKTDTCVSGYVRAPSVDEYYLMITRETPDDDWYISVSAPNGCYCYDGWWAASKDKTPDDAVQEAIRGACIKLASSPTAAAVGQEAVAWQGREFYIDTDPGEWSDWREVRAVDLERWQKRVANDPSLFELRKLYTSPQADALDALRIARAHIKWQAFGECRADGWEGPPPKADEAVAAIDAAMAKEQNQPDVFLRDLWDAHNAATIEEQSNG